MYMMVNVIIVVAEQIFSDTIKSEGRKTKSSAVAVLNKTLTLQRF